MTNIRGFLRTIDSAVKLAQSGSPQKAKNKLLKLSKKFPDNPQIYLFLGYCERQLKNFINAEKLLNQSIKYGGANLENTFQMGALWHDLGNYEIAEKWYRKSISISPEKPEVWTSLASVLSMSYEDDKRLEAISCQKTAISINNQMPGAWYNLFALLFKQKDLNEAKNALAMAIKLQPGFEIAQFYYSCICWLMGEKDESEKILENIKSKNLNYALESFDYIKQKHDTSTMFFSNTIDTLNFALSHAKKGGCYLEFGVNYGSTLKFIASKTTDKVMGFDSFQGLPEAWGKETKGSYSTFGQIPSFSDNVSIYEGWFSETIPVFNKQYPSEDITFIHIDCDLYSSTKDIFDALADRIVEGTIIVFDEYLLFDGWQEHEFKAFKEFLERKKLNYEYLAFGISTKQAVVRIL